MAPLSAKRSGEALKTTVLGLLLASLTAPAPQAAVLCSGESPEGVQVTIRIDSPSPGDELTGAAPCEGTVTVSGQAGTRHGVSPFDLYFILDASGSAGAASGADVDMDGILGIGGAADNSDPDDSVLAAEVLSVKRLVADLQGLDVRAAVIDFSAVLSDPGQGEQGRPGASGQGDQVGRLDEASLRGGCPGVPEVWRPFEAGGNDSGDEGDPRRPRVHRPAGPRAPVGPSPRPLARPVGV